MCCSIFTHSFTIYYSTLHDFTAIYYLFINYNNWTINISMYENRQRAVHVDDITD